MTFTSSSIKRSTIFILIIFFTSICGAIPARKRLELHDLRRELCKYFPNIEICKDSSSDSSTITSSDDAKSAQQPLCHKESPESRNLICIIRKRRKRQTDAKTAECQKNHPKFLKDCLQPSVPDRIFCNLHARNCASLVKLPICDRYRIPYESNCIDESKKTGAGVRMTKFCSNYAKLCKQPPPTQNSVAVRRIDDVNRPVECRQYQNMFDISCRKDDIDQAYKDFCPKIAKQCSWTVGASKPLPLIPGQMGSSGLLTAPGTGTLDLLGLKIDPNQDVRTTCKQYEQLARHFCYSSTDIDAKYLTHCQLFTTHCLKYYGDHNPIQRVGQAFNGGVGIKQTDWGVKGIPFYPFNPEGEISGGSQTNVGFGTWGGGVSRQSGVRDFWQQGGQAGSNWITGQHGATDGWSVPLVGNLASGRSGTIVGTPSGQNPFGPVNVGNTNQVGPWWQSSTGNVGVDWARGQVSTGDSWSVPFIGVGGRSGPSISFPSVGTFLPGLLGPTG